MKSYTDLEQSRKLAGILPLESADGGWYGTDDPFAPNTTFWLHTKYSNKAASPAWSLAALLDILPKIHGLKPILDLEKCSIQYSGIDLYIVASNPIDACYEMILKLQELNLL